MSNAKRAIMVPIMTLAVCAIAMVGLGFAITTSVTSNANQAEKLMVDLDSDKTSLSNQEQVDKDDVNKLFTFTVSTDKSTITDESVTKTQVIFTMNGGKAYFKVFGNVTEADLKVVYTNSTGSFSGSTPEMILTITDQDYVSGTTNTENTETVQVGGTTGVSITVGHVYEVQVTSFSGVTFTSNGDDDTYTFTGKYGTNDQIPTITTGTFGLTFTVES